MTVNTIGSAGGRNYASVSAYATYFNALGSPGTPEEGDLYNDSEFAVSGQVGNFANANTNATHYQLFTTGAGQSFRDNANVRTNALYYNVSNGVGLNDTASGGSSVALSLGAQYTQASNIQVISTDSGRILDTAANSTYTNCIFVGPNAQIDGINVTFTNCLFVNTLGPFSRIIYIPGTSIVFNFCTFVAAHGSPAGINYAVYNSGSATYNSCAFFGENLTTFNQSTGTDTFQTCMSNIASPPSGVAGGKTFANQFVSTTNDFRAKAGADLISAGTTISGITTDISGFTRNPSTPTIGAWEVGAAINLLGAMCL